MPTTPVAPSAVPDFPALSDRTTYNARAYAWAVHMDTVYPAEMQALASVTHGNAAEAVASAVTASTQVGLATAQVGLATAQVGLATAQAGLADADRVQTGLDRVQTGLDKAAAAASALAASKLNLGSKTTAPTLDNQGAALLVGATYFDTTLAKWRVWAGTAWADGLSAVAGVASINGLTGNVVFTSTSLTGTTTIYINQAVTYNITDFDSFSTYGVAASAGSAAISSGVITFTAPGTSGSVTLTLTTNGVARAIALTVLPASVATPTITSPTVAATGITETPTITTSAFTAIGIADTHLNSDWELWTGANRTGTKVASLYASTSSKVSWTVSTGMLATNTAYYPAVLHRGTTLGESAWVVSSFTTAANFNVFISTPTATPAAFGDSFEGGFYTGQIWNELVQSASSYAIGTGSKAFVVADMTATPLVYAGQTLEVRSRANPANKMVGTVTGAIGTTLTINITSVGGAGTFTDWSIMAQYRVIVAPKATGENSAIAYKNANDAAPAACGTLSEGRKATLAMVAAGTSTVYPAAHWCNNLSIAGKTDWYLPARDELELCWRNLKPTADANNVAANRGNSTIDYKNLGSLDDTVITHGSNNNTSPTGAAYIAGTPAQVAAGKNFRTSESEAFAYDLSFYWSASEYSASGAWFQYWHSSLPGYQSTSNKTGVFYVRAVRRSII